MSDGRTLHAGVERVAVIGLGTMGACFARHLAEAGYVVHGYDPDQSRRALCQGFGVTTFAEPMDAIATAEVVLSSLPSVDALLATVAVLERWKPAESTPPALIESSTLDLKGKELARQRLHRYGMVMLDCPVSGTGAQAARRDIIVYASGEARTLARLSELMQVFSRKVLDLGHFGNGTRMKLIANLLVAVHNVASAEALALAARAGIDPQLVYDSITAGGAASSRVLELRGPMMVAREYLPATMRLDLWHKDLRLIGEFASEIGAQTPLFDATLPLYTSALAQAGGAADTAAVFEALADDGSAPSEG